MQFSKENYIDLLKVIKFKVIDFHTPGNGIILRHDTDDRLLFSHAMAVIEKDHGVKSTYFILDTAPYWLPEDPLMWNILKDIQDMGHEIGWHNNAVTAWLKDFERKPLSHYIETPLNLMRKHGLKVSLTASHGDPMCYQVGYVNYNCFGFVTDKKGFDKYKGPVYNMKIFDLELDAIHDPHEGYLSDSGGVWSADPLTKIMEAVNKDQRSQFLIHPQWWQL